MALVPANIEVNFTANYLGQHRVAYRIASQGGGIPVPYNYVTVSCGLGACSALCPIFVDQDTCPTVAYEGYVQAACQDISSFVDRIAFGVNFIPSPGCKLYTVTCVNSSVASATVTDEGTGNYNPAIPPATIITGGGGTGATALSVVGSGRIIIGSVNSIVPGSGYTNGTYTNVDITEGSGTGGKATVTIGSGSVTGIIITSQGSGYQTSDVLRLDSADVGGFPAVLASFRIISDYGKVTSITITNGGLGYTSTPNITIAAEGGSQATATLALATCPSLTSPGCLGLDVVIPSSSLSVGTSVSTCSATGILTPGSQFTVTENGNCICNTVVATIGVSGPVSTQVRYFYNRKNGSVISGLLTVGGSPSSIIDCIVPGSLIFEILTVGTTGTVSYGGAC